MNAESNELWPGRLVTIGSGRHRGKTGVFLGYDMVQSGQLQLYPRVALSGSQQEVRVRTVTPCAESGPHDRHKDENTGLTWRTEAQP